MHIQINADFIVIQSPIQIAIILVVDGGAGDDALDFHRIQGQAGDRG